MLNHINAPRSDFDLFDAFFCKMLFEALSLQWHYKITIIYTFKKIIEIKMKNYPKLVRF